MGRRTKLTPELQEEIVKIIQAGNYRNVAAQVVGVAPETMCRWMSRPRAPYRQFRQAILAAEALAEAAMVNTVTRAARMDKDWRAAIAFLGRKAPERWAQKRFEGALDSDGQPTDPTPGVLVVPGIMDEEAWAEAAQRYKLFQPKAEDVSDDNSETQPAESIPDDPGQSADTKEKSDAARKQFRKI